MTMRRIRRLALMGAALAALSVPLAASTGAGAATTPQFHPPQTYYLALGDSLAFGYQKAKFLGELPNSYSAASFNTGYDADLAAMFPSVMPPGQKGGFTEVNYGCPGETTSSMMGTTSPCPYRYQFAPSLILSLHNDYPTGDSQLQAAVAFLRAHRGHVNPVTLDIGANDILPCDTSACVAAATGTMALNLDAILTQLQNAEPSAEIIVMNVPDPYYFISPATVPAFTAFNDVLDAVVAAHNDRLVDAFDAALAIAPTTFCTLSYVCTPPLFDIHPTDAGYANLAEQFWSAAGYGTLPRH